MTQENPPKPLEVPPNLVGSDAHSPVGKMGLFDHLEEVRVRLMRCLWVFFLGFLVCYLVSDHIMAFLRAPLFAAMAEEQRKLYFTSLFENFLVHLKVSGYASLIFFSPYYFYQIWGFVSPGLYQKEQKFVIPFVSAAVIFFIAGAAFAYYALFPVGFKFFISYGSPSDVPMLTIESYYSTALKLLFLFGVAFELPVVICFLGFLGLIDAEFLRKQRRSAIIIITIVAAFIAPPDAISMLMLGCPLVLMYEGSIWVVQWLGVRRKKRETSVNPGSPESDPLRGQSLY